MALKNIESSGATIREQTFLGPNAAEKKYVDFVVKEAGRVNTGVLHAPDAVTATRNIENIVDKASTALGGAFRTVADVETAVRTGDKKAIDTKNLIADELLLAMRDGEDTSGATPLHNALMTGNTTRIEAVLPTELKPWARDVRNRLIDNTDITSVLDTVSLIDDWTAVGQRVALLESAAVALNALKIKTPPVPTDQLLLARAAVKVLYDRDRAELVGGGGGGINYAEGMEELEKKTSISNFATLVDDLMEERTWEKHSLESELFYKNPSLVEVEGYDTPEGLKRWQSILRISVASGDFTIVKRGGAKPEEMMGAPEPGSPEKALERIHTNELGVLMSTEPAFREAARRVFGGIFKRDDGVFPGGKRRSEYTQDGRFFIKARRDGDINTSEYLASLKKIAEDLTHATDSSGNLICKDPNMAKIFVSMAGHLFNDASGAMDSADLDRLNNNRTPDPDRVLVHPLWKAIQKAGWKVNRATGAWEENDTKWNYPVLGEMGALVRNLVAVDRAKKSDEFSKKLLNGDWRYIPERTGASWTEMSEVTIQMSNGSKRTMSPAEFLLTVNETDLAPSHTDSSGRPDTVVFGRGDDDHLYGTYIRDWWPAIVLWGMAFKGKLPLKDARELPEFLSDWSSKMQDLRKIEVPGWKDRWVAAHPGRQPKDKDTVYLLDPWLRDPEAIIGGVLNVLNKSLLISETPLLPESAFHDPIVYEANELVGNLTGLTSDEKAKVLDLLSVPNLAGSELRMFGVANSDIAGLTDEARRRKQIERQAARNWAILNK